MQADKEVRLVVVGDGRAGIERDVIIAITGEDDPQTESSLNPVPQPAGDAQRDVLFKSAARTPSTFIVATVACVDCHDPDGWWGREVRKGVGAGRRADLGRRGCRGWDRFGGPGAGTELDDELHSVVSDRATRHAEGIERWSQIDQKTGGRWMRGHPGNELSTRRRKPLQVEGIGFETHDELVVFPVDRVGSTGVSPRGRDFRHRRGGDTARLTRGTATSPINTSRERSRSSSDASSTRSSARLRKSSGTSHRPSARRGAALSDTRRPATETNCWSAVSDDDLTAGSDVDGAVVRVVDLESKDLSEVIQRDQLALARPHGANGLSTVRRDQRQGLEERLRREHGTLWPQEAKRNETEGHARHVEGAASTAHGQDRPHWLSIIAPFARVSAWGEPARNKDRRRPQLDPPW